MKASSWAVAGKDNLFVCHILVEYFTDSDGCLFYIGAYEFAKLRISNHIAKRKSMIEIAQCNIAEIIRGLMRLISDLVRPISRFRTTLKGCVLNRRMTGKKRRVFPRRKRLETPKKQVSLRIRRDT